MKTYQLSDMRIGKTTLLTPGSAYDVARLELLGWTIGDGSGPTHELGDYFLADGTYRGCDTNRVEPVVTRASEDAACTRSPLFPFDFDMGISMEKTHPVSAAYQAALGPRLAKHVSAKLGSPATFLRWDRDAKTGADIPVFKVAASVTSFARDLGLTVEN